MLIVATFQHSAYLELAIILLEQKGISKDNLLVAPLDKQEGNEYKSDFEIVHRAGGSRFDKAFIFATICMLLGAIYGFVLTWGPIIWAMIGIIVGAILGLVVDNFPIKKPVGKARNRDSEVVLMVHCDTQQSETVERILWKHQALGVSKVNGYSNS